MSRFVLVHGSHSGAWIWEAVAAILSGRGHAAQAPDLAGYGANRDVAPSLDANLAVVRRALEAATEPALLVGHSMGGALAAQAACLVPGTVLGITYVAAFVPRDGETIQDIARRDRRSWVPARRQLADGGRLAMLDEDACREIFLHGVESRRADRLAGRFVADPAGVGLETIRLDESLLGAIPSFYVECRRSRAVSLAFQLEMQAVRPLAQTTSLDTGHCAMLEAPEALAGALEDFFIAAQSRRNHREEERPCMAAR
jgi:pimeloyl-ACP methyl ester carboxylesterase